MSTRNPLQELNTNYSSLRHRHRSRQRNLDRSMEIENDGNNLKTPKTSNRNKADGRELKSHNQVRNQEESGRTQAGSVPDHNEILPEKDNKMVETAMESRTRGNAESVIESIDDRKNPAATEINHGRRVFRCVLSNESRVYGKNLNENRSGEDDSMDCSSDSGSLGMKTSNSVDTSPVASKQFSRVYVSEKPNPECNSKSEVEEGRSTECRLLSHYKQKNTESSLENIHVDEQKKENFPEDSEITMKTLIELGLHGEGEPRARNKYENTRRSRKYHSSLLSDEIFRKPEEIMISAATLSARHKCLNILEGGRRAFPVIATNCDDFTPSENDENFVTSMKKNNASPRFQKEMPQRTPKTKKGKEYKEKPLTTVKLQHPPQHNERQIFFEYNGQLIPHAPLPSGWEVHVSKTKKRPFYRHPDYGTSWHCPILNPLGPTRTASLSLASSSLTDSIVDNMPDIESWPVDRKEKCDESNGRNGSKFRDAMPFVVSETTTDTNDDAFSKLTATAMSTSIGSTVDRESNMQRVVTAEQSNLKDSQDHELEAEEQSLVEANDSDRSSFSSGATKSDCDTESDFESLLDHSSVENSVNSSEVDEPNIGPLQHFPSDEEIAILSQRHHSEKHGTLALFPSDRILSPSDLCSKQGSYSMVDSKKNHDGNSNITTKAKELQVKGNTKIASPNAATKHVLIPRQCNEGKNQVYTVDREIDLLTERHIGEKRGPFPSEKVASPSRLLPKNKMYCNDQNGPHENDAAKPDNRETGGRKVDDYSTDSDSAIYSRNSKGTNEAAAVKGNSAEKEQDGKGTEESLLDLDITILSNSRRKQQKHINDVTVSRKEDESHTSTIDEHKNLACFMKGCKHGNCGGSMASGQFDEMHSQSASKSGENRESAERCNGDSDWKYERKSLQSVPDEHFQDSRKLKNDSSIHSVASKKRRTSHNVSFSAKMAADKASEVYGQQVHSYNFSKTHNPNRATSPSSLTNESYDKKMIHNQVSDQSQSKRLDAVGRKAKAGGITLVRNSVVLDGWREETTEYAPTGIDIEFDQDESSGNCFDLNDGYSSNGGCSDPSELTEIQWSTATERKENQNVDYHISDTETEMSDDCLAVDEENHDTGKVCHYDITKNRQDALKQFDAPCHVDMGTIDTISTLGTIGSTLEENEPSYSGKAGLSKRSLRILNPPHPLCSLQRLDQIRQEAIAAGARARKRRFGKQEPCHTTIVRTARRLNFLNKD